MKGAKITGGLILIMLSYAVLPLLSRRTNILSWIILIVSTVLFIIGASVIGLALDQPLSKAGSVVQKIILYLVSIFMIVMSFKVMIADNFRSRGIFSFTLILIEGIGVAMMAFGSDYNSMLDGTQVVEGVTDNIETLYAKFKNVDTPFGKAWLGEVNPGGIKSIIYGPTEDGTYLYGFFEMGKFFIGVNSNVDFLDKEKAEKHRINNKIGQINKELGEFENFAAMSYPEKYRIMFERYVKTGKASWISEKIEKDVTGNVYVIDETFSLTGEKYFLKDKNGNNIYDITGTIPLRTFYIKDSRDGSEIFHVTKKIFRIFPHYTLYRDGEKYGKIKQEKKLAHDTFSMVTKDGKVTMKQINVTVGANYAVYLDDKLIGNLSEKISLHLHDIIYDNFVLTVFDEKQRELLAVLAIMAERELVRDRNGVI